MIDKANRITLLLLVFIGAAIAGYAGHAIGYGNGYARGYADYTFFDHGCNAPAKAGDVVECYRYPMYMGKSENGTPPVKIVVDQGLFDRWIRARDDEREPSTSIDCQINGLGEVGECKFPVG